MQKQVILVAFSTVLCAFAQQKQQQRDLVVEKENPKENTQAVARPSPAIPRSYAVVIGVSKYPNLPPELQLEYSVRDAESIYSVLISPEGGNFRAENVHKLVDARATLPNIRHELEEWLPSVTKDDDRVLIYFAGHGFMYGGKGYLAPYDFEKPRAEATGYSMDTLGRVVGGKIKGKWKVLLTDACHSGAITPDTKPEEVNQKLQTLNPSLFSLTASRDREIAYENPSLGGGHGYFTYYVKTGMEGAADENGDGMVTADELSEYVRRTVREATGGKQNPTSDRGSFDSEMLLAYNPSGAKPDAPPAPKFGALIFESNMDGVELFVDEKSYGVMKKGEALTVDGLQPRSHLVKGVKMGYEPDGPREEMVYPGQQSTVKIRITILRRRSDAATQTFEKGIKLYTNGGKQNYLKAEEQFQRALQLDPKYSAAAMYLGRTLHALDDHEKAEAAYKRAIETDPDYMEARASYGGMLLDTGKTDEAVRQLNTVIQREPDNLQASYLLAEAYRIKEAYPQSIESAKNAIRLAPNNAEAHFWLAESLRLSGHHQASKAEYEQYLRLSNFDSKLAGQLNYYVLGYLVGRGKKTRASQADIWGDLRSLAYFGICDDERLMKHYDAAIQACGRSLTYDAKDPLTHFQLGLIYAHKAKEAQSVELLAAAGKHLRTMLALNPNMEQAPNAKAMADQFDATIAANR